MVLNRIARSIIESCRGKHPKVVFTYKGNPVEKLYNSGWKAARRRAAERYQNEIGRACPAGFRSIRVHDLKHAFGHRLRGAGVSFEDRKVLLGHKTQDVTTHYSAAEIGLLIAATERVCDLTSRVSPAIAVVRSRNPRERIGQYMPVPLPQVNLSIVGKDAAHPSGDASILPIPLKNAAAELAEAEGVSLDQFIAKAVAAAVADKIRRSRATTNPEMHEDLPSVDSSPSYEQARAEGLRPGFSEERYWRWPAVTPPKVPRAEIIKRRAAKFPWIE